MCHFNISTRSSSNGVFKGAVFQQHMMATGAGYIYIGA
jgi:hypothetical protein